MALRLVRVAVVGCPTSVLGDNSTGVGKSCLCNRFLQHEGYSEEHPSRVTVQEWEGSVINEDHFLYWGATTKFCACTGRVRFQVLEYTEFANIETGRVFPFRTDYIGRACEPFKSARKCAYQVEEATGPAQATEGTCTPYLRRRSSSVTTQVLFEEGQAEVSGYVCAFDPSLSEESGALQRQIEFLLRLLDELCKTRKPVVIACTKCDSSDATRDNIHTGKTQLTARRRHIPFVETSARECVNVEEVFFTLVLNMKRSRKTLGPLFVKKGGTSHSEPSTYKEVEYSRRMELRKARSAFQSVLKTRVVDFDTYWEEARAELEGQPEYQRMLELEDQDTLRKMFCNRLMEIKLQQASRSFEQVRSCPSLSTYMSAGSNDSIEERMKYSQAILKEAIASHPDLDSSAIYDFIKPSRSESAELGGDKAQDTKEQNGHEHDCSVKRRSTFTVSNNGTGHDQPLPLEEEGSDTDQEAMKESWNPFKHRSKSYMFSRSNKIKHNVNPDKTSPSLPQEKKDGYRTIAAFGTLPHKEGKKKKPKKGNRGDKVATTGLPEIRTDFEDYGQYSEENPPPLPPRPHELPPLQSLHPMAQMSLGAASNGPMWANPHMALVTSRRLGSTDLLNSCDQDESSLDFMQNGVGAPQEDASPYEVPVALKVTTLRKPKAPWPSPVYGQVRKTPTSPERGPTEPRSAAQYGSFRQPNIAEDNMSQKIGLWRLIGTEPSSHPLVSPSASKTAATIPRRPQIQRHRRSGSYDPSLLQSVRSADPPTLPHLSHQYPARSMSSVRPAPQLPPWPGKGRSPGPLHSTPHLESELYRTCTFPVQNTGMYYNSSTQQFPSPHPSVPDVALQQAPLEGSLHSRQSSLPDSLDYSGSARDNMALPTRPHHSQSNAPPARDHAKRAHMLLPGTAKSSKLTTQVRSSLKSSSECIGSEMGPSPKSSSEEREYTGVQQSPKDVFAFPGEGGRELRQKRRSTYSDDSNLYERIDDYEVQSILGQSGFPSPFPQPLLLSDANLDAEALREIQRWHLEFMQIYSHWMRNLDSIVQRSEQRLAAADRKEGRPSGSHKDSGTSTSLSREDLAVPHDSPTQEPPPPSAGANPTKVPTSTSQSSALDRQPAASDEPLVAADTAPSDDTTSALPISPPNGLHGNSQEHLLVANLKPDADTAGKDSQQQQCSESTVDETSEEAADEGQQQHSIKVTGQSEQQILHSERSATYESKHRHQQPQYFASADHTVQYGSECDQHQGEQPAGNHPPGYDNLIGFHLLQNGGSLHHQLPNPRKVSLV